jgi:hypothetical protein
MLTLPERILFIVAVAVALYVAYMNFNRVYKVILRGKGHVPTRQEMVGGLVEAGVKWLSLSPVWKTRTASSIFHALIAWGFVFYFLVNLGDVIQGYFPVRFLGEGILGAIYRFASDVFTAAVLVGMIYFLLRRFVFNSRELSYNDNVMLVDKVKEGGIRRDSLIVGLFILFHVGFRLIGESFLIALHRAQTGVGDPAQPFATLLSFAWGGLSEGALRVGHHVGWWVALGLILAFIPYFPYTKHFHLIMAGVNFLTKPRRTSLGELRARRF